MSPGVTTSVIALVNSLIHRAIEERGTDIHLEPRAHEIRVRIRVDGVLVPLDTTSKTVQPAVVSRIKIMCGMDIAESRLPQDGRVDFRHKENTYQLRISTLPTLYGEKIAIRILDRGRKIYKLEELGFSPDEAGDIRKILAEPQGLILLVGPTGSGKTTTLFSFLSELAAQPVNISTIEDPIEYTLPDINQTQVHHKIGLTFAKGLRTLLRQDPDVIIIGEIRDGETAEIAIQAATTGHLVLSTLHTQDTRTAAIRMGQLGVSPTSLDTSALAIISQRLLRKICPRCLGNLCESCSGTGYFGRSGIFEMESQFTNGGGMLFENAMKRVRAGETTIDEVYRVLGRAAESSAKSREAKPTMR